MKYALIDMGSNSIRLSVYRVDESGFKILFKEKQMAGLASYVENGDLSKDGIEVAVSVLNDFNKTLDMLEIADRRVFATASLRNINNTAEALEIIKEKTGVDVEVLSGEKEAQCGYLGAMVDCKRDSGIFVDIGGASSEITVFESGSIRSAMSLGLGSLKLYHEEVKKILPGKKSIKHIQKRIDKTLRFSPLRMEECVATGGSARACLRICSHLYNLEGDNRIISKDNLDRLYSLLTGDDKKAAEIILKYEPERIHTFIPGLMILRSIVNVYGCKNIYVSRYGIREGYLLSEIIKR